MTTKTKALVILSGGQDSTTCLFWALQKFDQVFAITFDYGQRHHREIDAAERIAEMARVCTHEIVSLGPILAGRSPLTNENESLETYADYESMDRVIGDRIELTFVPMRNALFLVLAANRAAAWGIGNLVTGVCQQDNANYPDCRRSFIDAQAAAINEALGLTSVESKIQIWTPLMDMTKAQSVKLARTLPGAWEALAHSHTAYDGAYPPLGRDHASTLRAQGFLEAGEPDPLILRAWREGLMPLPDSPNYEAARAG